MVRQCSIRVDTSKTAEQDPISINTYHGIAMMVLVSSKQIIWLRQRNSHQNSRARSVDHIILNTHTMIVLSSKRMCCLFRCLFLPRRFAKCTCQLIDLHFELLDNPRSLLLIQFPFLVSLFTSPIPLFLQLEDSLGQQFSLASLVGFDTHLRVNRGRVFLFPPDGLTRVPILRCFWRDWGGTGVGWLPYVSVRFRICMDNFNRGSTCGIDKDWITIVGSGRRSFYWDLRRMRR